MTTPSQDRPAVTLDLQAGPGANAPPAETLSLGQTPVVPESTEQPTRVGPIARTPADMPKRIGRFEIEEFLGEGGFGRVYKALDTTLKRLVALKVARPDKSEKRGEMVLAEAQASAHLMHPHIVAVFDTGHEGALRYIASAFIPGRSLQTVLEELPEGTTLPLRQAVEIVRKLAEALAYAHREGVIHRDVKPANVMLRSDGEPLLMDFGLASRGEGEGGQGGASGTPPYMAPEQWAGKAEAASDQYSLGCTLFQLLTGELPFAAGSPDHFRLLHETQPAPSPRKFRAEVPHDLEAICLKCLEKEPGKRYAGCRALADDLRRFMDGEPVVARPLGVGGRFVKWARRSPVVASLTAGVFVTLLAGIVVSWLFAAEARQQADVAKSETKKADDARDEAEVTLIDSLLMPIAHHPGDSPDMLERETMKRLTRLPNDALRLRFLKKGLAEEKIAERLGRRDDWVMTALVGLVPARREAAAEWLLRTMRNPGTSEGTQEACALLAANLDIQAEDLDWHTFNLLRHTIRRLSVPGRARLGLSSDAYLLEQLGERLANVGGRLNARRAEQAAEQLLAVEENVDTYGRIAFQMGMSGVLPRLAPAAAAKQVEPLVASIEKDGLNDHLLRVRGEVLAVALARLDASDAFKAAQRLLGSLQTDKMDDQFRTLGAGLTEVLPRLDAPNASKLSEQLLAAIEKATKENRDRALVAGLLPVLARLDAPKGADRAAQRLLNDLEKSSRLYDLCLRGEVLSAVLVHLDSDSASKAAERAVQRFLDALEEATNNDHYEPLEQGLSVVIGRLGPADASKLSERLLATIEKATKTGQIRALRVGLVKVLPRLDAEGSKVAGRVVRRLLADLEWSNDPYLVLSLMVGLSGVAARLDAADCYKVYQRLLEFLEYAIHNNQSRRVGVVLSAVLPRLNALDAYTVVQQLLDRVGKTTHEDGLIALGAGLSAVLPRLDAAAASKVAERLLAAIDKAKEDKQLRTLGVGLSAVLPRLDGPDSSKMALRLMTTIDKTAYPEQSLVLAKGLSAVLARRDIADASKLAMRAAQHFLDTFKNVEGLQLREQGEALAVVVMRLDTATASKVAQQLLASLDKTDDSNKFLVLAECLSAVLARLDPADASKAAERFLTAHQQTINWRRFSVRTETLPSLCACLPPNVCVRLLAHPDATPEVNRVVLDALGKPRRMRFRNAWHFVDWSKSNGVDVLAMLEETGKER